MDAPATFLEGAIDSDEVESDGWRHFDGTVSFCERDLARFLRDIQDPLPIIPDQLSCVAVQAEQSTEKAGEVRSLR
jgi:hypothetical protein